MERAAGKLLVLALNNVASFVSRLLLLVLTSHGAGESPRSLRHRVPTGPERKIVCPTPGQITSCSQNKNFFYEPLAASGKVIKQHDLSWAGMTIMAPTPHHALFTHHFQLTSEKRDYFFFVAFLLRTKQKMV
jgi:hypothetical protein